MIKIFRNIRRKLAAENNVAKYLRYAIGEVMLVVIGILIALQINNWNEQSKTSKLEIKILKELQSNLTLDLMEIQKDIGHMDDINKACKKIKYYLQKYDHPSDSLFITFSILRVTPHFDPNKSGYGLLQSKGVEVISNDSLRNAISLLYESSYPYYKRFEEERLRFHALHSEPILLKYFSMHFDKDAYYYGNFEISNEDFKKLKRDVTFLKLLSAITYENSAVQIRGKRVEQDIISLLHKLEEELLIKDSK